MDLKKMSLGAKLLSAFLLTSVVMGGVGYVGITKIRQVARSGSDIYTKVTIPQGIVADIAVRYQQMRAYTIYYIKGTDPAYLATQRKGIEERRADLARGLREQDKADIDAEVRALVEKLKENFAKYYASQERVFSLSRPDQYDERQLVFTGDAMKVSGEIQSIVDRLFEHTVSLARKTAEENGKTARSATMVMIALVAGGVIGAVLLGLLISRKVGGAMDRIVDRLSEGAGAVTAASSELSGTAQGMAEGSSEQAASLEETSSAMEEMSAMTRQNADNAGQAKALADRAGSSAGKANASMSQMVGKMDEISTKGEEVGKIIKTIDEIAFQTNLLALNAAVEAARAGEAGAGFAVVADEVRNLAQRAAASAKTTSDLLEGTIRNIREGTQLVETTNSDFQDVAVAVDKVTGLVGEISAASSEQARGITEVASALSQMDKVTQANAAGAEEVAASSEELSSQALAMQEVVDAIRELVNGSDDAARYGDGPRLLPPTSRKALPARSRGAAQLGAGLPG